MAFFDGEAKDSEQVYISVINCAPPFTRQRVGLNVEIESAHGEKILCEQSLFRSEEERVSFLFPTYLGRSKETLPAE